MNEKYQKYLQSQEWQEKKRQVFRRALRNANSNNMYGICEKCGYTPWRPCLQIHHKSYKNVFNEPLEDLILLCPRCHKAETEKQKAEGNSVPKTELSFEIKKRLAVLSAAGNYRKEINIIAWNKKAPSIDIRTWDFKDENEPKPLKGVTLAIGELKTLKEVLDGLPELAKPNEEGRVANGD